jgi:tetratricopeptide (TPR) repeat protein
MRLGEYRKAIADYKAVIAKAEENVEAYLERAKCYLYIDDYKHALDDCIKCEKLAPTLAQTHTLAAVAQLGLGHLDQAQNSIEIALTLSPNDPEAWALRANCDNLAIKHLAAVADATKAIALDPNYGSAYAYRGDAYEALKDYGAAMRDYTKNVELDPNEAQAFMRRSELYSTLGQFDKAVFDATEAIKLSPASGEAYYYRSLANDELGLKAQAKKDFARAKQLGL